MPAGLSDSPHGHLDGLGFGDGVGVQEIVDGLVGGYERKTVCQFKPPVPQASRLHREQAAIQDGCH